MKNIEFGTVKNEKEVDGIKDLCRNVFEEEVVRMVDDLYYRSPKKDQNVYLYARDKRKDKIVGTLNLIVVPIRYGDVVLNGVEYGIAATDPDYRNMGINKRLTEIFFQECHKRNYNIVVIEGIPYFYRRYGFNYAVPMGGYKLNITSLESEFNNEVSIRSARQDDLDFIISEARKVIQDVDICKFKDKLIIKAQILNYQSNTMKREYYILENSGKKRGYFAIQAEDDQYILTDISGGLSFADYKGILAYFKNKILSEKRNQKYISCKTSSRKFKSFLKSLGGEEDKGYSWQIKIMDEYSFLQNIKPVLEKRIKKSIFAEEEIEFYYHNYRELIKVEYKEKNLSFLKENRREGNGDLKLTPQGATKLFMGDNTIDEINSFLPDCQVSTKYRELIDILFPKQSTHFFVNY